VLSDTLAGWAEVPDHMAYAVELVEGVGRNADRIDELISSYAEGWTLDRMPVVDRNLCRIAVYEMLLPRRHRRRGGAQRGGRAGR
jgi:transcription termination factor NusB